MTVGERMEARLKKAREDVIRQFDPERRLSIREVNVLLDPYLVLITSLGDEVETAHGRIEDLEQRVLTLEVGR